MLVALVNMVPGGDFLKVRSFTQVPATMVCFSGLGDFSNVYLVLVADRWIPVDPDLEHALTL